MITSELAKKILLSCDNEDDFPPNFEENGMDEVNLCGGSIEEAAKCFSPLSAEADRRASYEEAHDLKAIGKGEAGPFWFSNCFDVYTTVIACDGRKSSDEARDRSRRETGLSAANSHILHAILRGNKMNLLFYAGGDLTKLKLEAAIPIVKTSNTVRVWMYRLP